MTRIGNNRLLGNQRLIISEPGECWISFEAHQTKIDLMVTFENDLSPEAQPTVTIEGKPDHAKIVLRNWNNTLGTATSEPVPIATNAYGKKLLLDAAVWIVGSTRILDIQMLLEGLE